MAIIETCLFVLCLFALACISNGIAGSGVKVYDDDDHMRVIGVDITGGIKISSHVCKISFVEKHIHDS